MTKKFLILFFFLTACGYEPLYINKEEIIYKKITLIGEKLINRKIISSLNFKQDSKYIDNNEIILESSKKIDTTSRNAKGQAKTFRSNITVKLTILKDNEVIKEKTFNESFSYQNIDNKYNLFTYQNNVEENLVNKIVDNLNIFLKI